MEDKIELLADIVANSHKMVLFSGAGVSTESGIPDFRSADGLYNLKYDYPPEYILSATFFHENPKEFFRFYRDKMIYKDVLPNFAHTVAAKWEQAGRLNAVVTQNIDGLHQKAGSKRVYELHGSVLRNYCTRCGRFYGVDAISSSEGVPVCECGGTIKPDVVLYEECLNGDVMRGAINAISKADTLIIAGTSLTVYPAAGMVDYFNGKNLVVVNMTPTHKDGGATLCIYGKAGETLKKVDDIVS